MYAKIIITLCALGLARGSGLYGAAPLAYSGHAIAAPAIVTKTISPAISSISSYSTQTAHAGPIASYAAGPIASYAAGPIVAKSYAAPALAYAAGPVATYAAGPVFTKTISPAVSSISSYSTQTAHGGAYAAPLVAKSYAAAPVATYAAAPVATYAAAPVATYAAAPIVTKTITPAVSSISSYSTQTAHGGAYAAPLVAKSYAAPALAYSAAPVATYAAAPVATYATAPVATYAKTYSPAVSSVSSYSTQTAHGGAYAAHGGAYAAPLLAKSYGPGVAYSAGAFSAPLIAKSYGAPVYSTYAAGAPILKSAVTYSAAPAVGHFAYSGHGANYGW